MITGLLLILLAVLFNRLFASFGVRQAFGIHWITWDATEIWFTSTLGMLGIVAFGIGVLKWWTQ